MDHGNLDSVDGVEKATPTSEKVSVYGSLRWGRKSGASTGYKPTESAMMDT